MSMQTSPGSDRKPQASRRGSIGGIIAVDQTEARLAFEATDVEADSTALGELAVPAQSHQLAHVRVSLALQEQLGNSELQSLNVFSLLRVGIGRKRGQLGDVALDSLGKLDLDRGSGVVGHGLTHVDAEIGQRSGAVFGALAGAASDSLGG